MWSYFHIVPYLSLISIPGVGLLGNLNLLLILLSLFVIIGLIVVLVLF